MKSDEDSPIALVKVRGYVAYCEQAAVVYPYPGQAARFCSEDCQLLARRATDRERKAIKRQARRAEDAAAGTIVRPGRPPKIQVLALGAQVHVRPE